MKRWESPVGISFRLSGKSKRKACAIFLTAMSFAVFTGGCSQKDSFDAADCASACLDDILKGDDTAIRQIAGDQADAQAEQLASVRGQLLSDRVALSLGDTGDGPGGTQLSPGLEQDYTTLWEDIFAKTDYRVSSAQQTDDDSWQVTVSAKQLDLYASLQDLLPEKLQEYSEGSQTAGESDDGELYASTMLDAYRDALEEADYGEEASAQITLSRTEDQLYTISEEDINTLMENLLDLSVMENGLFNVDPENAQTEATPNTTIPQTTEDTVTASVGETVSMEKDGSVLADFSVDQVAFTDARSPYDSSNPEKVVVITYTYTNTASSDPLLFDEMSFTVTDGDTVCTPYYLDDLQTADIAQEGQGAVTASLAYGVSSGCTDIVIHVNNPQLDTPVVIDAAVS
ncbi:MAG TPA: hypothetical protein IAA57_10165 [Candidatus Pullilachnospira intestinigallinarum]|nr:hypothetical protein [Candidatus Pullilachnospira intestinigallinarum]